MSQPTNINVATSATTGRTEPANFTTELNAIFNAFLSAHGGSSRPSYAVAGIVWRDTDDGALYLYDGSNDLLISAGGLRSQQWAELTIATGAVTPTGPGTFLVDTESDAASDDLDTLTATNMTDGDIVILRAASGARSVVIKHATGNIQCGSDFTLDNEYDRAVLQWDNGNSAWVMLAAQSNGT